MGQIMIRLSAGDKLKQAEGRAGGNRIRMRNRITGSKVHGVHRQNTEVL